MHDKHKPCPPPGTQPCSPGPPSFPPFAPPPGPPCIPDMPPVPSVVEGESLYQAMNNLSDRVNTCINVYNDVMRNAYATLQHLEAAAAENGAYYGPCEVWSEQGYDADLSANYYLIHKAVVDRHGEPIRIQLKLAYNNTTNSQVPESIQSASLNCLANVIVPAQPVTPGQGWFGNAIYNSMPIPSVENESLYTVGFTRNGTMRVYANSVPASDLLRDGVENAMGVSGVLVQQGQPTTEAWIENIPNYGEQASRICMGQNYTTKEVVFLVCGVENVSTKKGLTSAACAKILADYGCTVAVELCQGVQSAAMESGQLMFTPADDKVPEVYAYWYITRACHYKNDYQRELAELMQNYGTAIWETYLNHQRIDTLRADMNQAVQWLQENINKEVDRAMTAEGYLQENINKEVNDRIAAVQELKDWAEKGLNDENQRAVAEEKRLQEEIDKEADTRQAMDENLQTNINAEVNRALTAEGYLQENINREVQDREAAVEAEHEWASKAINDENKRAVTEEKRLQESINREAEIRQQMDDALQTNINAEVNRAMTAEGYLQENINKEVNDRIAAVAAERTQTQADVSAENQRAVRAENMLDSKIRDVSDRVDTLTNDLQTLNTRYLTLQSQLAAITDDVTAIQTTIASLVKAQNNLAETIEQIRQGIIILPYLSINGGTLKGNVNFENPGRITNLDLPQADTDAASKEYVDATANSVQESLEETLQEQIKDAKDYTDQEIAANAYTLPAATETVLGGIKVGENLSITEDGVLSASAPGSEYELPPATTDTLGGVKVGDNLTVTDDGTISAGAPGLSEEQVDSKLEGYLPLTGGTLSGPLTINETGTIQAELSASELKFTNGEMTASLMPVTRDNSLVMDIDGAALTGVGEPKVDDDAATKGYVDNAISEAGGATPGVFIPWEGGEGTATQEHIIMSSTRNEASVLKLEKYTTGPDGQITDTSMIQGVISLDPAYSTDTNSNITIHAVAQDAGNGLPYIKNIKIDVRDGSKTMTEAQSVEISAYNWEGAQPRTLTKAGPVINPDDATGTVTVTNGNGLKGILSAYGLSVYPASAENTSEDHAFLGAVYDPNGELIFSLGDKQLHGVATPTDDSQAANKAYVDNAVAQSGEGSSEDYIPWTGGTLKESQNIVLTANDPITPDAGGSIIFKGTDNTGNSAPDLVEIDSQTEISSTGNLYLTSVARDMSANDTGKWQGKMQIGGNYLASTRSLSDGSSSNTSVAGLGVTAQNKWAAVKFAAGNKGRQVMSYDTFYAAPLTKSANTQDYARVVTQGTVRTAKGINFNRYTDSSDVSNTSTFSPVPAGWTDEGNAYIDLSLNLGPYGLTASFNTLVKGIAFNKWLAAQTVPTFEWDNVENVWSDKFGWGDGSLVGTLPVNTFVAPTTFFSCGSTGGDRGDLINPIAGCIILTFIPPPYVPQGTDITCCLCIRPYTGQSFISSNFFAIAPGLLSPGGLH